MSSDKEKVENYIAEMHLRENRVHPRTKCNKLVYLKFINPEGQIVRQALGHILDISQGGVKILTPIVIDTKRIMITTLDLENKSIGVRGEVVNSSKNEAGGYLSGVKFNAPHSSCVKFIKAVITTYFSMESHQQDP